MFNPPIEPAVPFTEMQLASIEQALGRPLPREYRDFASVYGGAFVGGSVDGKAEFPILTFFGVKAVLLRLDIHDDLKADGVLPVADCEMGNLYVIDRQNVVHYINYYGGQTIARRVADSFDDMLKRIVVSEE
ncbi:SMI1/KNR4 family protein [Prosthecobacter sp.]|uniref:SMI1/KNR4 family protein n=1 Tax=Prosthecobacter sp. TaxID=1965333 RepID=UPI003783D6E8